MRLRQSSIAVVIPACNAEQTIAAAIRSVLAQVAPPEEIIVVDDGSVDDTAGVVTGLFDSVRLIRQPNQGAAVARQTGTAAATTDYIAYLDADDWWPEGSFANCREAIEREKVDFLLADLQRARPGDGEDAYWPRNRTFFPWADKYFSGCRTDSGMDKLYKLPPELGLSLLLHGYPVFPSTMLVRREVLETVGGWDARFRRCQDFDLGLRIARYFPLHYLDEVQAILGLHEGNENARDYYLKQTRGDIRVLLAHLDESRDDATYRRQVAEALGRKYCGLGYSHRVSGEGRLARENYLKSFQWPGKRTHALIRWCLSFVG
ncbi:hypothetical protein C2E25_09885 [Geothermobacter hydrogeniphilus]|uniref:Glycosyltransferase 2-like domain-containing protein n=1 Tax=Geothermobacter hydrogeniphilus TaxID=1969733 RepID=A0A2K2H9I8_9BACT|nr:glycosyltransferase family 2 protein [Geothermobacter hydrogeniphilus]PNU19972.1 hypothetical protein C2E25_09885 [Geothermobacter hydrogeniphilus]